MNNQAAQTMPFPAPKYKPEHGVYDEPSLRAAFVYWENLMYLDSCGEDMTREQADDIGYRLKAVERAMEAHDHTINEDGEYVPVAALSQTAGVPEGRTVRVIEVEKDGASRTSWSIDGYGNTPLPDGVYKIVRVERPAMIERAAMLAAAPAASGGEDIADAVDDPNGTCPTCHQYLRTDAGQQPPAGASVSERARGLLAAEYSKCGMQQCAADIRAGVFAAAQQLAVNAIKVALEQKVPSGEVAIVCDWSGADPFPTFIEAEVGGKSVSLEWRDRPDGLKELIVPVTDSALEQALTQQRGSLPVAQIRRGGKAAPHDPLYAGLLPRGPLTPEVKEGDLLYTTPQPGAEALRELVQRAIPFLRDEGANYADDGSNEPLELARELESLLGRGGAK